tara:strand:+ start:3089 stop:3265 length:177 start_codon:yes stop_codon:yes gene_type:complete
MKTERIRVEAEVGQKHSDLSAKIARYESILIKTEGHEKRYGKWSTIITVRVFDNGNED